MRRYVRRNSIRRSNRKSNDLHSITLSRRTATYPGPLVRIKLIAPKMSLRPMDSEFKRQMTPSIALLVLAALTPPEHDVEIIDENIAPVNDYARCDLVGITCNVDTFTRAKEIASRFREGGTPVIAGGIFASSVPHIVQEHVDAVCIGDAEPVWPAVLLDAAAGYLQRVYRHTEAWPAEMIPLPKWEAIDKRRYLYTNVVTTSRGCPHTCEFCYNSCEYAAKGFRRRPVESVVREIEALDTKQVLFVDDNFIGDTRWLESFLPAIAPMGLTWHAAVSADIGSKLPLLDTMQRTGCRSLFIGFESINQNALAGTRKRQNRVQDYERTIREIHDRGIMVNASMVFGFDEDDAGVFDATLEWLIRHRIETMTAHILTPYPGTKLHDRFEREGRITDRDLAHYNTSHVVFQPARMSPEELRRGYLDIYDRFYSIGNILRRTPTSPRQWAPHLLFNLGYRRFGAYTSKLGKFGLMHLIGRAARRLSYGIG
jgi:radical SAM superfamily enzyme YgiQ (UPF0313 family)